MCILLLIRLDYFLTSKFKAWKCASKRDRNIICLTVEGMGMLTTNRLQIAPSLAHFHCVFLLLSSIWQWQRFAFTVQIQTVHAYSAHAFSLYFNNPLNSPYSYLWLSLSLSLTFYISVVFVSLSVSFRFFVIPFRMLCELHFIVCVSVAIPVCVHWI